MDSVHALGRIKTGALFQQKIRQITNKSTTTCPAMIQYAVLTSTHGEWLLDLAKMPILSGVRIKVDLVLSLLVSQLLVLVV
jgi:hypothetical protein